MFALRFWRGGEGGGRRGKGRERRGRERKRGGREGENIRMEI